MEAAAFDPGMLSGKRRKKGGRKPLATLSKKHLFDRMGVTMKRMREAAERIVKRGIPKRYSDIQGHVYGDYFFALWDCDTLEKGSEYMERVISELMSRGN